MRDVTWSGRLLVAPPSLLDPNFARTVVLVIEHNAQGALGVILNRPTSATMAEVFPEWAAVASPPAVIHAGGPVGREQVLALARPAGERPDPGERPGWVPVAGGFGTVDLARRPDEIDVPVSALRVFAGYAGWSPGQLDGEVAAGGWYVVDAGAGDPFDDASDQLWSSVLRRQGGPLAWVARAPLDPSAN